MKKLILFLTAVIACGVVSAQTHKVFCEIVGTQKFAKYQVTVAIDFGQEGAMRSNALGGSAHKNRMVDESGNPIEFNSMVDAMNYMGSLGWEFEQAYVITMSSKMGGGQNVYHWLLSKSVSESEMINNGFTTKSQFQENVAPKKQEKKPAKKRQRREYQDDLYF